MIKIKNTDQNFLNHFERLKSARFQFLLWQVEEGGNRQTTSAKLHSVVADKALHFIQTSQDLSMLSEGIVYLFCPNDNSICRSTVVDHSETLILSWPQEIMILDNQDFLSVVKNLMPQSKDYMLVNGFYDGEKRSAKDLELIYDQINYTALDEEDVAFKERRESPRGRPKFQKEVELSLSGKESHKGRFELFDLSRGGMSFLSGSEAQFPPGSVVDIYTFNEQILEVPIKGQVMSVRELEKKKFKVGIKFLEDIQ